MRYIKKIIGLLSIIFFVFVSIIVYSNAQTYNNITDVYTFQNDNNGFSVCNFATTEDYTNNVFGATDSNAVGILKQYLGLNTTYFMFNATTQNGKYFNLGLDDDNLCSGLTTPYTIQINAGADFVYIGNGGDYHLCYLTIEDILNDVYWIQNKSLASVYINNTLVCSYAFITPPDDTFNYISLAVRDIESFIDNISIEYNKYKAPCFTSWSCVSYADCINDNKLCNSVIDLNNCSVSYTGNYTEFTPQECCIPNFICNGYGVCNNESLNPSCNMHIDNNFCGLQNCISAYDTKNCGESYLKNCSYNDTEIVLTNDASLPLAFVYSWFENVPYNNEFCGQFFKVNESKVLKGFTFITGIVNTGGNVTFHLKEGYTLDYSQDLTKGNIFVYPEWAYYNAVFDIPYLLKPNISYYIFLDVNEENETIMDISAYGIDYNTNPDLYLMCNVTSINTILNLSSYIYTMNLTFEDSIFCGGNYSEFSLKKCNLPPIIDIIYSDLYNTMATNKSIDTIGFIFLIILFVVLGILINYGFWFIVSVIFLVMAILSYIDTGDYRTNIIKTILYFILALCFSFLGLVMLILSANKNKKKGYYDEFYD